MNDFLSLLEDPFLAGETRHDKSVFGKEFVGSSRKSIRFVDHYRNAGFFRSHKKRRTDISAGADDTVGLKFVYQGKTLLLPAPVSAHGLEHLNRRLIRHRE